MSFGDPMNRSQKNELQAQTAMEVVVELTHRYRMMTARHLHSLREDLFPRGDDAVRALDALVKTGQLRSGQLYSEVFYYFAAETTDGGGLSENAKIRNYAMLAVCTQQSERRTRLNQAEFKRYFPGLCRPGLPMNYYVDIDMGNSRLGFLRVDLGGHGRWDRILSKARDDARRHKLEPAFRPFVQRDAMEIRIVTTLPQKAERIRREIPERPNPAGIPIHVSVVPELLHLIAPLPIDA